MIYNQYMEFYGIEKFSLVDYDEKVCVTLFSAYCNFACPFCHNSFLVFPSKEVEPISFDEILKYLKSRVGLIDAVTISGGEPMLMDDLIDKIKTIKKLGYLIKLDTNGTNPKIMKYLIDNKLIDYVAMDVKNSLEKYPITIGKNNIDLEKIVESINILKQNIIDYEFRTTLVKEFHDEKSIEEMGKLIKGAKKLVFQKFVDSEGCIKKGLHPIDETKAKQFVDIICKYVDVVKLRGY